MYIVGFAVVAALGIPLTPLVLLAGALFGFFEGLVVAWVARLIGGALVTRGARGT